MVQLSFSRTAPSGEGERLCSLPMQWLMHEAIVGPDVHNRVPLVMFDHPCLFRQATLAALDQVDRRWRVAVTTPSLPGIWGALRSKLGIAVRTGHGVPDDIVCADDGLGLPSLPAIELRLLRSQNATPAAHDLCETLRKETIDRVAPH